MRLIRLKDVLDRTALSRSVLYDLMSRGQFPHPTKAFYGGRTNVWSEGEIEDFIASRLAEREAA